MGNSQGEGQERAVCCVLFAADTLLSTAAPYKVTTQKEPPHKPALLPTAITSVSPSDTCSGPKSVRQVTLPASCKPLPTQCLGP